jgi:hypothetical protein
MNSNVTRIRLLIAEVTSGATLLLSLLYTVNFYDSSFPINTIKGETLIAIALSVVAFVLALKIRTFLVAALLTVAGIVIWIPPVAAIIEDKAILVPGPILGVIFFAPIIGLGIAKFATNYFSKRRSRAKIGPKNVPQIDPNSSRSTLNLT